jgi:hypothetical protein
MEEAETLTPVLLQNPTILLHSVLQTLLTLASP